MNLPENYEIDALIPEYTDKGDCTHIYLRDGRDFLLPITQRSVLRNIAIRSHCDMTSLRAEVAAHTNHYLNNPMPVDEELVLCPVKVREPRINGDPGTGYINVAEGVTLAPGDEVILVTPGGHKIPTLWSRLTIQRHLQCAVTVIHELRGYQDEKLIRRLAKIYNSAKDVPHFCKFGTSFAEL